MNQDQFLEEYEILRKKVNVTLEEYFNNEKENFKELGPEAEQSFERIKDFVMRGGKRIRPILTIIGYQLFNGPKEHEKDIIKASLYAELLHGYFLIHDDVMDRDNKRRGKQTIHAWYRDEDFKNLEPSEAAHHGNSMAILDGDILESLAEKALLNSSFPDDLKVGALKEYNITKFKTGVGQKLDIFSTMNKVDEEYVKKVHLLKSAEYTILRPLRAGAILAGATDSQLETLTQYGYDTGLAFQLRDDELGLQPENIHKSKNDIVEGKRTIIVQKALEAAPELEEDIGKELNEERLKEVIEAIEKSGAIGYNHEIAVTHSEKAQEIARTQFTDLNPETAEFLEQLAKYVLERGG